MITLPDPLCKKVGSTNLFSMYIYKVGGDFLLKSFNRFYSKYPTLDLQCDSNKFKHAYSLEDIPCTSCKNKTLELVYKTKIENNEKIGLGRPRIFCKNCKSSISNPNNLEFFCKNHKNPNVEKPRTKYFLIGNNNKELSLIMTLMAADLDSDMWYTTQYFQAFNSEETTAVTSLNFLENNRKLRRPKKFEAKTLDVSPFNRKNNLYKITNIGRNYYQSWLEESGFVEHLPKFVKHRDYEIFDLISLVSANKSYEMRNSEFKKPTEEEKLQVFAKHVPKPIVDEIWTKDYNSYWSWRKSLDELL